MCLNATEPEVGRLCAVEEEKQVQRIILSPGY